jgi:putative ABC transport system permease protein
MNLGVIVPENTAIHLWGLPRNGRAAQMLIHTRLGAAQVVAAQAPIALRPEPCCCPRRHRSPRETGRSVTTSLNTVFLAGKIALVGRVGIANTTLVAVLERAAEISCAARLPGPGTSGRSSSPSQRPLACSAG